MNKHYTPKTLGIIGYGRFGAVLYRMLKSYFTIVVHDTSKKQVKGVTYVSLPEVCQSDVVVFAVPISKLEAVVKKAKKHLSKQQTVMDVSSVKVHPKNIFSTHLKDSGVYQLLTHPMFGPDSTKDGFKGLPVMIHGLFAPRNVVHYWKALFKKIGLEVAEMTPEEHDKEAAFSQGVTHFMGRVLDDMNLKPTSIDTKGFKVLMETVEQTCNDTWELFKDLQHYNPYTKKMRKKLEDSFHHVQNQLMPTQVSPECLTIGIQGGRGSYNEEACHEHCEAEGIIDYKIKYLYTSERVLKAVHDGEVDIGQCATQNSIGGVVRETIYAIAKYESTLSEEFEFIVRHCLHVVPGTKLSEVKTIMSHPQALAQCQTTLAQKYPHLKKESGKGVLIDHALVAEHLAAGKLPKSVAVLASKHCGKLNKLETIAEGLQDRKDNYTSFVWLTPRRK